jgi:hypothetical protein
MPKHIIVGLFETFETLGQTLTRILENCLKQYGLTKNILANIKNKGANLNTMAIPLKLIVSCEAFGCEGESTLMCNTFRHMWKSIIA